MQEALQVRLKSEEFGLTSEQVDKLIAEGVQSETDLGLLGSEHIKTITGCTLLMSLKFGKAFAPAPVTVDINAEIPEGEKPTTQQVNTFATQLGMDPNMLSMMMMAGMSGNAGMGGMDISGMIPIPQIVAGYNPKIRNLYLMIMGQVENRLGVPVVVINEDGSVNSEMTIEYIMGLEEGRDPAENNIYFDGEGNPHEVIKTGVDAQSIYDADPIDSTRALQKNDMGTGRINWKNVSLEARQTAFYAVRSGEIDATNDNDLSWLRDHIKPGVSRLVFAGKAPKAIGSFNEARRTGALPTLRVTLNSTPRKKEFMPRRTARIGGEREAS